MKKLLALLAICSLLGACVKNMNSRPSAKTVYPPTAKVDHVLHVTWGKDGGYSARVVDLKHVLETGDMKSDVALGPNDVVFVPKTAIANADLWVRQYLIDLIPIREPSTRIDDFRQ